MKSKEFKIGELFDTTATQTNEITKFQNGNIPFICASNLNNGIQGFVIPNEKTEIEEAKCITVSSLDGTSFWQKEKFIGRGHGSVNVLRNKNLNEYNAQYICTCLKTQVQGRYNYSHQLFLNNLKNETISLPVDKDGNPD
ncbi:MAG: hypothetical protein Ta2D_13900 [Rickettsiales bacterium]|nr:MAG: hypothetical protein Ta2D_13900 [Rickettsiales bacterium]